MNRTTMTYEQLLVLIGKGDNTFVIRHCEVCDIFKTASDERKWTDIVRPADMTATIIELVTANEISDADLTPYDVCAFEQIVEHQIRATMYTHWSNFISQLGSDLNLSYDDKQSSDAEEDAITILVEEALQWVQTAM